MRTSRLYHQLQKLLGQSIPWADQRHCQTLIWMVIGLVCSESRISHKPVKKHQYSCQIAYFLVTSEH